MKGLSFLLTCLLFLNAAAQQKARVLFIGNSYTYVNDLPTLTKDVALSTGDTLVYDSNTPGGSTFQMHTANTTTLAKISQGGWDYVVLQEQSQLPSFPPNQVQTDVFHYAQRLDSLINATNTCAETMFYMTWGRKNGDASNCGSWPPVCTYQGMDSMLYLNYMQMATDNHAVVSPVGAVWHWLRTNYPALELYNADESHPSPAGSYAAACSFYTAIFRKDPTLITYNFSLPDTDAVKIRNAAKAVVFNSLLTWHIGEYDPHAAFTYNQTTNQVQCNNATTNANSYWWQFGDGDTSTQVSPAHTYTSAGTYTITLIAANCSRNDTFTQTVVLQPSGLMPQHEGKMLLTISPNPVQQWLQVEIKREMQDALTLEIVDLQGRVVFKKEGGRETVEHLDLSRLPAATYTLLVRENNQVLARQKVVKQ